jgi:hypothetical protein
VPAPHTAGRLAAGQGPALRCLSASGATPRAATAAAQTPQVPPNPMVILPSSTMTGTSRSPFV